MKGDHVKVCLVGIKDLNLKCPTDDAVSCVFDWLAKEYSTSAELPQRRECGLAVDWKEEFEIFIHPMQHKVIRFEVVSGKNKYGKCQIDLGHLKAGESDAWYPLSRLDTCLPFDGYIRVKLTKVEQITMPATAISAVLPTLDASVAQAVEADYVAALTKEEREAFYSQGGLRAAVVQEDGGISDDGQEIQIPTGMMIPKFWTLKQMFPALSDREIYLAMNKFEPFDMNKTIEYVQTKQNKQGRMIQEKLLLDGGKLAAPPMMDAAAIARNEAFLKNANAGDMMNVNVDIEAGAGQADASRRKALLIGCDYTKLGPHWQLQGAPLKDIRRVRSWLEDVWGFANEEGRMMMMADDHPQPPCRPTKGNMVRAFEWLGRDCKPGDSLFVYYTGHGGSTNLENTGGFEGELPFWYGIDGKMLSIDNIYDQLLNKLPESVRVTFVVDCPNWHLWQPFYYDTKRKDLQKSSHQYFLQPDIQVFTSLASTHHARSGGTFTNAFLNLTSGRNIGNTKQQLLEGLNDCMDKNFKMDLPKKLEMSSGLKMNYYTCSQKTDLSIPFDLNSWAPNMNVQIGMKPTELSVHYKPSSIQPQPKATPGPINFRLNITSAPDNTPPPPVQNFTTGNQYGIGPLAPPHKAFGQEQRRVSVRESLSTLKKEYKDNKVKRAQSKKNID